MPLFQYQQKVEPLLPIAPPALPPLTWLASYPDTVPHRRSRLAPFLAYVIIPTVPSTTPVRVTQANVETLIQYTAPLTRVTQAAVEVLQQLAVAQREVRVTQIAIEIIYPFGCFTFVPPLPAACPVEFDSGPNTQPCADDAPIFP